MSIDLFIAGIPLASYAYVLWLGRDSGPGALGRGPRH